ncbi:MAG: histidine phosphatase family protein [Pseudomonadota bacterium]
MHRRGFLAGASAAAATGAGFGAGLLPAGYAAAQADLLDDAGRSLLARLAQPGVHAIMRHAIAPGTGDPAGFTLADCSTQRTLDREGRVQAVLTGRMLKMGRARFRLLLSSQWCRCLETARLLGVGTVMEQPALNSFIDAPDKAEAQTAELRRLIDGASGTNTMMLVTHQVNISALLGGGAEEGEVIVFRGGEGQTPERLGSVRAPEVSASALKKPVTD